MARIRTIKPEFWEDEKIARLSMPCRLFFIGTWSIADDAGVFRSNCALLKSKIFPYEDIRLSEIQKHLDALVEARMILPISHNGESFYVIRTFRSHQKFDARYPNYLIDNGILTALMNPQQPPAESPPCPHRAPDTGGGRGEGEGLVEGDTPPIVPPVGDDAATVAEIDDESQSSTQDDPPTHPDPPTPPPTWKESFEVYQDELRQAYRSAANDKGWINKRQKFHPNLDIMLSLEKACADFWSTEEGWCHKLKEHRRKGSDSWINWRNTFNTTLTLKSNQVFKPRNQQQDAKESY